MDEGGPPGTGDGGGDEPAPPRGRGTRVLGSLTTLAFLLRLAAVATMVAGLVLRSQEDDAEEERERQELLAADPVCAGAEDGVASGLVDVTDGLGAEGRDTDAGEGVAIPAGPLTWQCRDQERACAISFELPWSDGVVETDDATVRDVIGRTGNYAYGPRGTKVTFPVVVEDGHAECTGPRVTHHDRWPPP